MIDEQKIAEYTDAIESEARVKVMSQEQHYYRSVKRLAEQDALFLEMSIDMTSDELRRLIAIRPQLWGRYSNWLDKLPAQK